MRKLQKLVLREAMPLSEMEMIQVRGGYQDLFKHCKCALYLEDKSVATGDGYDVDDNISCQTVCDNACNGAQFGPNPCVYSEVIDF